MRTLLLVVVIAIQTRNTNCWWGSSDSDSDSDTSQTRKKGLLIDFPKRDQPQCTMEYTEGSRTTKIDCKGQVGKQYPPQVELITRKNKHVNITLWDGSKANYAIGPLDWGGRIYIQEGNTGGNGGTTGNIVLSRNDMLNLFRFFNSDMRVAVRFRWA